jgi:hypothetical protein
MRWSWPTPKQLFMASLAWVSACGSETTGEDDLASDETTATSSSTSGASSTTTMTSSEPSTSESTSSGTATDTPSTSDGDETDTGGGDDPSAYCGRTLFAEPFEDDDFASRGWYDGPSGSLTTDEHVEGSTSSFVCRFAPGATGCEGGTPGRHLFDPQMGVCLSYWVKYSANWQGSGLPYHPHEFHFITNADTIYVGPANTHLTTYIEQVGGTPRLALQDSRNVDTSCILLNNDGFVGCDGDFDSYPFTEARSAAACNGLLGDLDGRDCFSTGNGYYSARFWDAEIRAFGDEAPWDKNEWHLVQSYWRLNDIEDGIGIPNGVLRYWVDGELLVASDQILMRTGVHPDMRFDQFLIAPYIGDGSPVDQTMWVDDLVVAEGL